MKNAVCNSTEDPEGIRLSEVGPIETVPHGSTYMWNLEKSEETKGKQTHRQRTS